MDAHFQRALLLFQHRRLEEAEKEIARGFAENPHNPMGHAILALCLAAREQFDEATQHAQQAVGLAPDMPWMHSTLARVWFARRHLDKAEAAVAEALKLDPQQPDHFVLHGQIQCARQRWLPARMAAEQALTLDPEHVAALNLRAEALRKLGQAGSAEAQLLAALAVDPDDADTHASLGWVYLENGNRPKAMQHFREALRLDAELDSARAGVVETLKACNPAYRLFLKYIFWMQKLGTRGQWIVILGAYLAYRIVVSVARDNPALAKWLWPLIAGYLLFVVVTWLAQPIANLMLRLHPFGRLALSRDQRIGSNFIGGFILAAVAAGIAGLFYPHSPAPTAAIVFGLMLLPLGATFQSEAPWPRKALVIYTAVVGLLGLLVIVGSVFPDSAPQATPAPQAAPAPPTNLLSSLCNVALPGFLLGVVLSLFAGNILMSIPWKR